MKPNTHRNTQLLGGKAYGNGQLDDAGGYFISGSETLMSNLYTQDNLGDGFRIDGAVLVQAGQLFADRNCVGGIDTSGMIINNCDGIIVDGYGATDTQRKNPAARPEGHRFQQPGRRAAQPGPDQPPLGAAIESNSGGVTVYTPV